MHIPPLQCLGAPVLRLYSQCLRPRAELYTEWLEWLLLSSMLSEDRPLADCQVLSIFCVCPIRLILALSGFATCGKRVTGDSDHDGRSCLCSLGHNLKLHNVKKTVTVVNMLQSFQPRYDLLLNASYCISTVSCEHATYTHYIYMLGCECSCSHDSTTFVPTVLNPVR